MTRRSPAPLDAQRPFRPCRLVLSDNTEIHVEKPDQVKHKPGDRIAVVIGSYGEESIIDLDLVALIEVRGMPVPGI